MDTEEEENMPTIRGTGTSIAASALASRFWGHLKLHSIFATVLYRYDMRKRIPVLTWASYL